MDIGKLKQNCKDLSLLYVEDNTDTRVAMQEILSKFFPHMQAAADGQEGLNEFRKKRYDIVVTDIEMPKMNGLQMIEQIKKLDKDVVTAITTAYNEQDLFLQSIELNINKYLIKPIGSEDMLQGLDYLSQIVINRQKAKELEQKKLQEKINHESESIVQNITASTPNPVMIYDEKKVLYINDAFACYLDTQTSYQSVGDIEKLFLQKPGCMRDLSQYSEDKNAVNKIALSYEQYTKYFQIIKTKFSMQERVCNMLTLNDITKLEYQKIKLENYNKTFREYVFHFRKKKTLPPQADAKDQNKSETANTTAKKLDVEEESILRKNHAHEISAATYLEELDEDTIEQMQELSDVNEEMSEYIQQMKYNEITIAQGLNKISERIAKYVHTISILFEFQDLMHALHGLGSVVDTLASSDETMQQNALPLIEAIVQDLQAWENAVFINQDTLNIHYLDSSLFSSCLQLEMLIDPQEGTLEEDDDDMEFF